MLAALLMAASAGAIGLTLWQLRQDAIETARGDAGNIASVLARQATYSTQAIDLVLEEIQLQARRQNVASQEQFLKLMASKTEHEFLTDRLARLPQVEAINVTDKSGRMIASSRSWPAPVVDISDRDHFQILRNSTASEIVVGEPVFSRVTGTWTMFFARRIESVSGEFLGVVLVAAQPATFMRVYDAISGIPGASSLLLRRDGTVYLRHPDAVERTGDKLPAGLPWYDVVARGGGYYRSAGVFDNEARWVAVRPLEKYPLVVNVAISERVALEVWRARALVIVVISSIMGMLLATLLVVLFRHHKRVVASEAILVAHKAQLNRQSVDLTAANTRFDAAIEHMSQGLAMFDPDNRLVIHNDRYAEIYGLKSGDLPAGTPLREVIAKRVAAGCYSTGETPDEYFAKRTRPPEAKITEIDQLTGGRFILVNRQLMKDGGWVSTHEDVTDRQKAVAQIAHMAHHDALTGLANRAMFRTQLAEVLTLDNASNVAILLADLDEFKEVNDTHGHAVGDALLRLVATRLRECCGPNDLVARLGGDEFAIVCRFRDGEFGDAVGLAEKLLANVRSSYQIEDRIVQVGLSIGVAFMDSDVVDPDQIMRQADIALYRAKTDGRNRYRLFEPKMEEVMRAQREIGAELLKALANDELDVHYQPIIDAATLEVRGMEALARWPHKTRGMISPGVFIPIAEQVGLISQLGEWVLARACRDAAKWPALVKVAVNVSPIQFSKGNLIATVAQALKESKLPPWRLELEVTESVLLTSDDNNISLLHELHDMGVSIALDDFGTGYSSLSYLTAFPLDKIKIDKSFIDRMGTHKGALAIVSATTNLARAFNAISTAEGVETQEQFDMLRVAAVTQVQGYFFGKPMAITEWEFIGRNVRARGAGKASAAA